MIGRTWNAMDWRLRSCSARSVERPCNATSSPVKLPCNTHKAMVHRKLRPTPPARRTRPVWASAVVQERTQPTQHSRSVSLHDAVINHAATVASSYQENMTSSIKPEVHNVLERHQRGSSYSHKQHAQKLEVPTFCS